MRQVVAVVTAAGGLHARPAVLLVETAQKFKAEITVRYLDRVADAKSILSVLALGAARGTNLTLTADGEDEDAAITALLGVLAGDTTAEAAKGLSAAATTRPAAVQASGGQDD